MSLARFAKRRDANEPDICKALMAAGATVLAADAVDLIVGFRGKNYLLECKLPKAPLTQSQKALVLLWAGQYAIVRSVEQALAVIGA